MSRLLRAAAHALVFVLALTSRPSSVLRLSAYDARGDATLIEICGIAGCWAPSVGGIAGRSWQAAWPGALHAHSVEGAACS